MIRVLTSTILVVFFLSSASAQDVATGSATTVMPGPTFPDDAKLRPAPEHQVPVPNDEVRELPQLPQTPVLPQQPALPAQPER